MSLETTAATAPVTVPVTPRASASRRRRYVEAGAFVTVWVAAGYALPISSNAYLLLGVPLTIAFQLLVRRRPLRDLFVRPAARIVFDRRTLALAAALALTPLALASSAVREGDWSGTGWYLAAAVGALCAAVALRAGTLRGTLRAAALPILVGSTGMATVYATAHLISGVTISPTAAAAELVKYAALYFPATFLLEEVSFRGALDSHVHHDADNRPWASAVYVSALWGLWHLPVSHALPLPLQAGELVVVHVLLGLPLSFAWRRTRNLAGPALAHAVNDAVRNAFLLGL